MRVSVVSSVNDFEGESVTDSVFTDADGLPRDDDSDRLSQDRKVSVHNIKVIEEQNMTLCTADIPVVQIDSTACQTATYNNLSSKEFNRMETRRIRQSTQSLSS